MKASLSLLLSLALLAGDAAARRAVATPPPPASSSTPAAAASQAAASSVCRAVQPFYWEIGDRAAVLASGSVGAGAPTRTKAVPIASASKWLYGAYVAERGFTEAERPYLNMTSGYESLGTCSLRQTVSACAQGAASKRTDTDVGRFAYDGAHMQMHAAQGSLGKDNASMLGADMSKVLGVNLKFTRAQLAGGAEISAADYAAFLQKLMRGELKLGASLGAYPVCTDPGTCKTASKSPVPVAWLYSFGHWVETPDGDGAFSSPGAFGFYPAISADKALYEIVARSGKPAAWAGAKCGAAIRAAFVKAR